MAGSIIERLGLGASSAWNYVKGQCTYYVAQVATWIPAGLGNAADWLHNAQAKGLQTTTTPTPGAVAVYGRGHGYDPANGHVALVDQVFANGTFSVEEQNFDERGTISKGRVSTTQNVLGFILPPGTAPGGLKIGPLGIGNKPADPFAAIGAGFQALGDALHTAAFLFVGVILGGFGLYLLLKAEGKGTTVVTAPAAAAGDAAAGGLRVLKGGKAA